MADQSGFLAREYEAINAHLRGNIRQFVNWFGFFLTASLVALAAFLAVGDRWPEVRLVRLRYAVPGLFLFLHLLAFVGMLTFRRYIAATSPPRAGASRRSSARPGARAGPRSRWASASG